MPKHFNGLFSHKKVTKNATCADMFFKKSPKQSRKKSPQKSPKCIICQIVQGGGPMMEHQPASSSSGGIRGFHNCRSEESTTSTQHHVTDRLAIPNRSDSESQVIPGNGGRRSSSGPCLQRRRKLSTASKVRRHANILWISGVVGHVFAS